MSAAIQLEGVKEGSSVISVFSRIFEESCRKTLSDKNQNVRLVNIEPTSPLDWAKVVGTRKWCTWIMVVGDLFETELHFFYNSGFVPKLLEGHPQKDRVTGNEHRVNDLVKELTNLTAGTSLGIFERAKISAVIGIPVTSRGIDYLASDHEAFSLTRLYVGKFNDDSSSDSMTFGDIDGLNDDDCLVIVRSQLSNEMSKYKSDLESSISHIQSQEDEDGVELF